MLSKFESMSPALYSEGHRQSLTPLWPTPKLDKHNQKPYSPTQTLTLGLLRTARASPPEMLVAGTGTEMGT